MSIIIIGDVHGTAHWKDIVNKYKQSESDIVVFLGDYLDSFIMTPEQCYNNLLDIFEYKSNNKNVHMLIGNHDFHYMKHTYDEYSGFNMRWKNNYYSLLMQHYDLLELTYTFEYMGKSHICSHAGVTQVFLDRFRISINELNQFWKSNPSAFGFNYDTKDCYGDHPSHGPLWVRPSALMANAVAGYNQIVGHTNYKTPVCFNMKNQEDLLYIICTENELGYIIFVN